MRHRYRIKTAWLSYVGIQVAWVLLVFFTPIGVHAYPSRLWALPFCCITSAGGLHMTFFRYEYNALLRKAVQLFPYARYVTPSQRSSAFFLPVGIVYTLVGVASAALVLWSLR